jgi:prepilin peptidase CpaA
MNPTWAVVVLALSAAWCDLRSRKVPNAMTIGAAVLGLMVSGIQGGAAGAAESATGWLVGLAVLLPLFMVGGMGGGDVKLLAAFGAWLGPIGALRTALWAALLGGAMALAVAVAHGYVATAFRNLGVILRAWRAAGPAPVPGMTLGDARGPRLAYAVAISAGAVLACWLGAA